MTIGSGSAGSGINIFTNGSLTGDTLIATGENVDGGEGFFGLSVSAAGDISLAELESFDFASLFSDNGSIDVSSDVRVAGDLFARAQNDISLFALGSTDLNLREVLSIAGDIDIRSAGSINVDGGEGSFIGSGVYALDPNSNILIAAGFPAFGGQGYLLGAT